MEYAEAIMKFMDDVDAACGVGEDNGLDNAQMADELARIAQQLREAMHVTQAKEKLARALATVTVAEWGAEELGSCSRERYVHENWGAWLPDATAALEALLEPSDGMIEAGSMQIPWEDGWGDPGPTSRNVILVAIQAALSEREC